MYAYKHIPTNTWVYFLRGNIITLSGTPEFSSKSENKDELINMLKNSSFNQIEGYGRDNFLEFKLKKVK